MNFSARNLSLVSGLLVLSGVLLPLSASASTSSNVATLYPIENGIHTGAGSWNGGRSDVDETGNPSCSNSDSVADDGGVVGNGEEESYTTDLSSIPNGATITGVDVDTYSRLAGATTTAGTYKSIIILNGLELAYPSSITPSTEGCALNIQSFAIGNYVKTSNTTLEIGVVKSNSGDVVHLGAIHATITYSVSGKSDQTLSITTHAPGSAVYRSTFSIAATSTSGLPIAYTLGGGCSISEASLYYSVVTMMSGTIDCVIHYTQAGDDSYNSATELTETITAQKRNLTVTATGVNKVYDTTTNAEVTFSTDKVEGDSITVGYSTAQFETPDVEEGIPLFVTGLAISGESAENYTLVNASASAVANITIASATVSLAEEQNLNPTYDGTPKSLVFTTDPEGLALAITYNGETTAPTVPGEYTVIAAVTNSNYYAGTNTQTLTISKANQTITFSELINRHFTADFAPGASSSSGLPVTFTVSGDCTTDTNEEEFIVTPSIPEEFPGSCTVTAHQGGNSNYNSAENVSETFSVTDTAPTAEDVSKSLNEGSTDTIALIGSDADEDSISYSLVTEPSHGVVTLEGDVVTYVSETGFAGLDSFTYKVNDGPLDSTAGTVSLTIFPPSHGSGGGSGGGSFSSGISVTPTATTTPTATPAIVGEVLGAQMCTPLITSSLFINGDNDSTQVKALQTFLNSEMDAKLPVTGFFGALTLTAVKNFQLKYWQDILLPWVKFGLPTDHTATGRVIKTTSWKINTLNCVAHGFSASDIPFPQIP